MRKGLGHSEPFGKRKPQNYRRSKPKPPPRRKGKRVKAQR